MYSFPILFTWLGYTALSKLLVMSAADDGTLLTNPIDAPDPNSFWNLDDTGLGLLDDSADECVSLDSGFLGAVRARELCGGISSSHDDGDLFSPEGSLDVEGSDSSYDVALFDPSSTSDSLSSLDPTTDLIVYVGASCQSDDPQNIGKFRPRDTVCKDPEIMKKEPKWDPDQEWGITAQGHPDYERLRLLPYRPPKNIDESCPGWVVGRRYAVCGPDNEASDVIGDGITLRNCKLCR